MERYRIEIDHAHDVKPGNIVGAIASEAGLDSKYIDQITIHEECSTVDLPEGMPKEIFKDLKKTWVVEQRLNMMHHDNAQLESAEKKAKQSKGQKC